MPSYKTVKKRAHDEFTEKRSRFIGYVCPVQTVEEANGFISEIKAEALGCKAQCLCLHIARRQYKKIFG